MGFKVNGAMASFAAGANLNTSTSDYMPVYINSSNSVAIANTTTNITNTVGIITKRPNSGTGAAVPIQLDGIAMVKANDTFTAGDLVIAGSGGAKRGTALTVTTNQMILGRALESVALTSGVIMPVALFIHPQAIATTTILG